MNIWKKEQETRGAGHELMNVSISDLNLSVRSYNCLKRAGCDTVGDILALIAQDENGLRKIRNLGSRSEKEILECVQCFKEEFEKSGGTAGTTQPERKIIIKPARKWWDTEIEVFHLSDYALARLKENGIHYVRDLYATNPRQEPGWYAVRELFEKIPCSSANT